MHSQHFYTALQGLSWPLNPGYSSLISRKQSTCTCATELCGLTSPLLQSQDAKCSCRCHEISAADCKYLIAGSDMVRDWHAHEGPGVSFISNHWAVTPEVPGRHAPKRIRTPVLEVGRACTWAMLQNFLDGLSPLHKTLDAKRNAG